MLPAIIFIGIYLGQHLKKLLLRVADVPQQLIVEMQDAGSVSISGAPVIHGDVVIQLLDDLSVDSPADGSRQPRPGVNLDGGNLHKGHQNQKQTAPAS